MAMEMRRTLMMRDFFLAMVTVVGSVALDCLMRVEFAARAYCYAWEKASRRAESGDGYSG